MEKIKFESEDGIIEFFVEEQTTVAGITYLLVSDSQDDEANAYIMKDVSEEGSQEASYEMVEDDEELLAISKVFDPLLFISFSVFNQSILHFCALCPQTSRTKAKRLYFVTA